MPQLAPGIQGAGLGAPRPCPAATPSHNSSCAGAGCRAPAPPQLRRQCTTTTTTSSRRCIIAQVASPEAATDAVVATRQTYIQESINFSGAELAARLPSMQAALRAQRGASSAAAAAAAAAAASSSSSSSRGRSGGAPAPRAAPSVPPAPTAARAGPAAAAAAAAAVYNSSSSRALGASGVAAAAAAASSSSSVATQEAPAAAEVAAPPASGSGPSPSSTISSYEEAEATMPAGGNLQGLSASEKLQALQQVQKVSKQALHKSGVSSSPYYASAPKTIDIRMYDQLVAAHNKLSGKLSDTNAHIAVLEGQINQSNEDLIAAFELLKQIAMEFGTTSRLAQGTAAAVQFGVDPQDALDKISKLQERLSTLEQAVLEQRDEFGKRVVRKVPVEWIGVASEVKIMGDFDDWTRGTDLSAEDVASDSVYSRFEGTLCLRPGTYRVKFLVDSEWRLAADWPTEKDQHGNEVCLLTVT